MAAGGHFGCAKITFDRISGHFRSIRNFLNLKKKWPTILDGTTMSTRLLGRPLPQMYPLVNLNQYTWVNRTHKHFLYMLQGPMKMLK